MSFSSRRSNVHIHCFRRSSPVVLVGVALLAALTGCGADPSDRGPVRVGAGSTSLPPWPAPTDVAARVASAGLDLGQMGMGDHYHPQLQIIVGGTDVPVPANIGVDTTTGAMSAVHTHEADGTIHIEAEKRGDVFTLGQLFKEWGVVLTSTQIGGVKASAGTTVEVTSNGARVQGAPGDLRLEPEQMIVLRLP